VHEPIATDRLGRSRPGKIPFVRANSPRSAIAMRSVTLCGCAVSSSSAPRPAQSTRFGGNLPEGAFGEFVLNAFPHVRSLSLFQWSDSHSPRSRSISCNGIYLLCVLEF
jgi:hypothetical protein